MIELDHQLTLIINSWHGPFWDPLMRLISTTIAWLPLFAWFIFLLYRQYGKRTWILLLFVALLITLCDRISVMCFKDVFCRLRPTHDPLLSDLIHAPGSRGGLYGFVSSHATNYFGMATLLTLWLRKAYKPIAWGILFVWAAVIAYSRIYLGVHFLGDVLAGALLGSVIAYLVYRLSRLPIIQRSGLLIR